MSLARRLALAAALALLVTASAHGAGTATRAEAVAPAAATPTADARTAPAVLEPGDRGPRVRDLQARLAQLDWFNATVTGYYGPITTDAVRGFQGKRGFPATGNADRRTLRKLRAMTRTPSRGELHPDSARGQNRPGPLDRRCRTGRVLCVDKSSRTVRWVVGGQVRQTLDARFGGSSTPTREGSFEVFRKSRDHVSSLYGTPMPYAMFFSGGQAVHYSPDFAAVGYDGASHGCVNVRDKAAIARIFDQVRIGDRVVVYWS